MILYLKIKVGADMIQAIVKKLDNYGNRVQLPIKFLKQLGIDKNDSVLISIDSSENCIKISKVDETEK